jgi:hypothetical protein
VRGAKKEWWAAACAACALLALFVLLPRALRTRSGASPPRPEVERALRKAVEFYRTQVAREGGYHARYAADLSYGRSDPGEGPTRISVRYATPLVGLAYLRAYEATRDRYYLEAALAAAHALVRGQLCSGGWDYSIELDPEQRKGHPYRSEGRCPAAPAALPSACDLGWSTLDNNTTQSALRFLMRVDRELEFRDALIHEAARFALAGLMRAQYPNGAFGQRYCGAPDASRFPVKRASYPDSWPRRWPKSEFRDHYTLNDDSLVDAIDALLEAARTYRDPSYRAAAEKAGDFLLLAQMPEPQPGWAQQYDADMHPSWGRVTEPPALTGGESQGVLQILLALYRESGQRKYLEPVPRALAYYLGSALPADPAAPEPRRRRCPRGSPCLARFYELRSNRPLYLTRGTRLTAAQLRSEPLDGYELSYSDDSVIAHYRIFVSGERLEHIRREHAELARSDGTGIQRPDRLSGASPWQGPDPELQSGPALDAAVRRIVARLDPRGAWVETGSIARPGRLLSLSAGAALRVTARGRVVAELAPDDVLEVLPAAEPPVQQILQSQTFARNVETLAAYLSAPSPAPAPPAR